MRIHTRRQRFLLENVSKKYQSSSHLYFFLYRISAKFYKKSENKLTGGSFEDLRHMNMRTHACPHPCTNRHMPNHMDGMWLDGRGYTLVRLYENDKKIKYILPYFHARMQARTHTVTHTRARARVHVRAHSRTHTGTTHVGAHTRFQNHNGQYITLLWQEKKN